MNWDRPRGRHRGRLTAALPLVALVAAACLLGFPFAATASMVTIGETVLTSNNPTADLLGPAGAPVFQGAAGGGYVLRAPVSGTITSWSFMSGGVPTGNRFVLRVLRPDATSTNWTGVGTSAPEAVVSATGSDGLEGPFATSLPVQAGDVIALQPQTDGNSPIEQGAAGQDGVRFFSAALPDGSTAAPDPASAPNSGQIVPVQATVTYNANPPPANTRPPVITGSATVGATVTCTPGSWSGDPTHFAYQWRLDGAAIPGQTASTHVIAAAEAGHQLSCQVTASGPDGFGSATSTAVTVSGAGGRSPGARVTPRVLGGRVRFDATASTAEGSPIVGYRVRLSDSPTRVIACGANSPIIVPVFSRATSGTAVLTVLAANGTSASATTRFHAPAVAPLVPRAHRSGDLPAGAAASGAHLIAWQCLRRPGAASGAANVPLSGGVPISSACELNAGIVQVEGCGLTAVSDLCSGVPRAERLVLEGHMVQQAGFLGARTGVGPCGDELESSLLATLASVHVSQRVQQALLRLSDVFWVSTDPVRINGLDFFPKPGSAIVIATGGQMFTSFQPASVYVVSSGADVKLGGLNLPLSSHRVDLDVGRASTLKTDTPCPNQSTVKDLPLGRFSLENPFNLPTLLQVVNEQNPGTPLANLPRLPVTGSLSVALGARGTAFLAVNVALNRVLGDPQDPDGNFTGCTVLTTSNLRGVDVSHFEIDAPQVDIGVQIQFKFVWDGPTRAFTGAFFVDVDSLGGQVGGQIDFRSGVFADAAASYTADLGGGFPIGGGFFIVKVEGKFFLYQSAISGSQTALSADMRISLGPAVDNNGCGLLDVEGNTRLVFYPGPLSLDSVGALELYCYPVVNRYFHADAAGHVEVGMSTGLDIGPVSLSGNIDGQAFIDLAGTSRVQLDATGKASIDFGGPIGTVSAGFDGSISDRGAGFCASFSTPFHTWEFGLGESFIPPPVTQVQFLTNLSVMFDGCDLSKYRTLAVGGPPQGLSRDVGTRRRAARRPLAFAVAARSPTTMLALQGAGGAPDVTLGGPGGQTIDTAANSLTGSSLVLRFPNVTLVELAGSQAGKWTLAPDPGSPAIAGVRSAHVLPRPRITARVTGSGAAHVLHYAIARQAGLRVTFLERGTRGSTSIGPARGLRGMIRFLPSDAHAGLRTVIAAITENGMPARSLVVAHYQGSPPVPGRPTQVRFRYTHGGLVISFGAAPLATSHTVALALSDGRGLRLVVGHGRTALFVPRVSRRVRVVRISVRGMRDGLAGRPVLALQHRRQL